MSSFSPTLHDTGFLSIHLRVPLFERLSEDQIFLLEQESHASRLELDRLIDRLRLRLGHEAAGQVQLVESHLPEKAWLRDGGTEGQRDEGRWGGEGTKGRRDEGTKGGRETKGVHSISSPSVPPSLRPSVPSAHPSFPSPVRPLRLLPPTELRVIVTPSHDAEGRPAAFVYDNQMQRVMCSAGPERIAGCWWDGRQKTRDYFDVEDNTGRRFWIFRVLQTGKWYVHGRYE